MNFPSTNPSICAPILADWSVIVGKKLVLHNFPTYLLSDPRKARPHGLYRKPAVTWHESCWQAAVKFNEESQKSYAQRNAELLGEIQKARGGQ